MRATTVLITSAGSLVGRAVLDTLEGRRDGLRIVGCSSIPHAPDLERCDAVHLVPPTGAPGWDGALRRVLDLERPDAVVPGRDRDVRELTRLADSVPALASTLLAGSAALAAAFDDKAAAAEFARRHDLPHVRTVATDRPDAARQVRALLEDRGLPLIAKPVDGSGSRGVRVLTDPAQVEAALQSPGLVLQPFLDPPSGADLRPDLAAGTPLFWEIPEHRLYAVQTIIARDGSVLGAMSQAARMVRGRPEELWTCDEPELDALGAAFARAAIAEGWRGPLNVQAKRDVDGRFLAIEVNGRFSGGTSGRLLMGFDEVQLALDDVVGRPVVPAADLRPVRRVVRLLSDVAFDPPATAAARPPSDPPAAT